MTRERRSIKLILRKKQAISVRELCTDLLEEVSDSMNHLRDLSPDELPNYAFPRILLRNLYDESRFRLRQRV
jgi:hypothetical protein